jgi:hypothetical protein
MNMDKLRKNIEIAINSPSAENGSDTPDFILAEYLTDCLAAYDKAVVAREKWHERPELPKPFPLSNAKAMSLAATRKAMIQPIFYALAATVVTPLIALCMVMAGILMILGWPFIPILCYFQRKEEISKAND